MRILITGGAGFIGSAVSRQLVGSHGVPVVNVDKLTYSANLRSLDLVAKDCRYAFEQADICDRAALDAIFERYRPTAVLHLAAESHVDRSITGADAFLDTNVIGTYRLLGRPNITMRASRPRSGLASVLSMCRPTRFTAH